MRFGWLTAAIAALWAMPAQAVTIVLQQPTSEAGLHQKISLTGLTGADTINANAILPAVTSYFWQNAGDGWYLKENDAIDLNCTAASGGPACHEKQTLTSTYYPVKSTTSLDLNIVGNDVFIDWTMFAQDVCASISDEERDAGRGQICGYGWYRGLPATLDINVTGPGSQTFGYTVTDITSNPVPEPTTWALMIIGIGFAGAALRRRRYEIVPVLRGTATPAL